MAVEPGHRLRSGTAVPDQMLARAAASHALAGFEFYRGIPGAIGGALRMNAGAHGRETKDCLVEATAIDRQGRRHILSLRDLAYTYRHCGAADDLIFTSALYQGSPGDRAKIQAEMDEVASYRETHQPVKARTGGSTFKNPPGHSAWKLVDAAGLRGFRVGGAHVSEKHCNFLINDGERPARMSSGWARRCVRVSRRSPVYASSGRSSASASRCRGMRLGEALAM